MAREDSSKTHILLLNGQPVSGIGILDRAIHYGDGVFETIAVIDSHPLCWDAHMDRLIAGCVKLKIDFTDTDILEAEMRILCKNISRSVLKITITSGAGGRGYQRPKAPPHRLLAIHTWPEYPQDYVQHGTAIHLCSSRLGYNPLLSGIKHLNRLEQVLARNEWYDPNVIEGMMLDLDGHVVEGTMSNLFIIYPDRKLLTPDLSLCGINGIVRQYILDHCADFGYQTTVKRILLEDIYAANEIFFCNSIIGILPVKQLANHKFSSQVHTQHIRQILIQQGIIA